MKKFILTISLVLIYFLSTAQNPTNRSSSTVTAVDQRNWSALNYKMPVMVSDTFDGLKGGIDSIGLQIWVKAQSKMYVRDTVLSGGHKWTEIGGSAGGGAVPTWQQTLDVDLGGGEGSILTHNNVISLNSTRLMLQANNGSAFSFDDSDPTFPALHYDLKNFDNSQHTSLNMFPDGYNYSQAYNAILNDIEIGNGGYRYRSRDGIGGDASLYINPAGSLVLNTTAGLFAPALPPVTTANTLFYNTVTGQITYGAAATGGGADATAWHKPGDAGTDSTLNFIGTTDLKPLNVRTNSVQRFSFAKDRPEIQTYTTVAASQPFGGGFYVNAGNKVASAVLYPGANIGISGGHTGYRALDSLTGGYWNVAIGDLTLNSLRAGAQNVAIGFESMRFSLDGNSSVAIGTKVLRNSKHGFRNTVIGDLAASEYDTHYASVGVGDEVFRYIKNGHDNTGVGSFAVRGSGDIDVSYTVGMGVSACEGCGSYNTALGTYAASGAWNLAIENVVVGAITTGGNYGLKDSAKGNVLLGFMAGFEGLIGNNNIIAGRYAGAYNNFGQRISGRQNIILGPYTNGYTQFSDANIAIGSYISNPGGVGADRTLSIGNVLYGSFMYDGVVPSSTPVVGGKIGIRVKTPLATLHIDSDTANVSGLRFEKLTSASPVGTGATLGVDASGKVIVVPSGQLESFTWKYTTNPAHSDPGTGNFRMNNISLPSVTELWMDDLTSDVVMDMSAMFARVKGDWLIHIQQSNDATKFVQFHLNGDPVDETDWWTIPVTYIQSGGGGGLTNLQKCTVIFLNENSAATMSGFTQKNLIPRLTTTQRRLYKAQEGDIVYDKSFHRYYYWNGTFWRRFN